MEYDNIRHAQLAHTYKNGAKWFYWIAGLTIITSLIAIGGGGIRFLLSLGLTQIIDGIAAAITAETGSGAAKAVALVLDLIVSGIFVLFGYLSNQKQIWAYLIGMVMFLLDGLLSLVVGDIIGVVAHAVVLFFLVRGFLAGRELLELEKAMAQQAATPQPEPAI
jgi:hypothetical protein